MEACSSASYEESKDFSIALTWDTNGALKIGLDIIGADGMVTSLAIERESCVISSISYRPSPIFGVLRFVQ